MREAEKKEEERKKRPCSGERDLMNGGALVLVFTSRILVTVGEFNFHRTDQTMFY